MEFFNSAKAKDPDHGIIVFVPICYFVYGIVQALKWHPNAAGNIFEKKMFRI